jgi:hypothetical protein
MSKWYRVQSGPGDKSLNLPTAEKLSFNSSWLRSGEYDPVTQRCIVTFSDSYQWVGSMSSNMWESLKAAPSKGRWWHAQKGNSAFWRK